MPVGNPARFFISGSDEREFIYEGGSTLFAWSPYDSRLSTSMESNVVFFANDETHARDVLRRLFEFWIECNDLFLKSKHSKDDRHGLSDRRACENRVLRRYLEMMEKMKITPAPTNQFYQVSWACNDNLNVYER